MKCVFLLFTIELISAFVHYYDIVPNLLDEKPTSNIIYVIESEDPQLRELNKEFQQIIQILGYTFYIIPVKDSSLIETMYAINNFRNVINMKVSDFYKYNLSELESNFYISSNGVKNIQNVCSMTEHAQNKTNGENIITYNCNEREVSTGVKIFSKSLGKSDSLLNIMTEFSLDYKFPKHILVCDDKLHEIHRNIIKQRFKDIPIIFKVCDKELETNTSSLAVLAPSPKVIESNIPFVFYDTIYLLPEQKDSFPYSTTLMTWKHLKYAFLELMKWMDWHRVALLSDDHPFSEIFEQDLISIFDLDIYFTLKKCTGRSCDFEKPLKQLNDLNVVIIIANVAKENIEHLVQCIRTAKMNHGGIHWIFRERVSYNTIKGIMEAYSIYLTPDTNLNKRDQGTYFNVEGLPNIIESISFIHRTYADCRGDENKFGSAIRSYRPPMVLANIIKATPNINTILVLSITGEDVVVLSSTINDINKPSDVPGCVVRSTSFERPCSDTVIILLIVVIMVFLMLFLIIILFFDYLRSAPMKNYVRS